MIFGYGRFGCAGKPLAQMELHKVYFEVSPSHGFGHLMVSRRFNMILMKMKLFRYFDFQLVNPARPWKSEVWTIWIEKDFMVQVTEASLS